jgi:hypothetical protein
MTGATRRRHRAFDHFLWVLWSLVAAAALMVPRGASARPLRPRFEPTDLELEEPGIVEVDLQVGFVQGAGPYRLVVPDLELDFGVFRNLEIDLDWTEAIEQPFDHTVQDNVWLSAKVGLYDSEAPGHASSWALGVQFGPRFAAAPGARGAGFEGLVLVEYEHKRIHLVFNSGGIVDPPMPGPTGGSYRPEGLETGINVQIDIDRAGVWSMIGSIAAVYYFSIDPHQLLFTAGAAWTPRPWLSLSLTALAGALAGGDRYGFLIGYSQKLRSPVKR